MAVLDLCCWGTVGSPRIAGFLSFSEIPIFESCRGKVWELIRTWVLRIWCENTPCTVFLALNSFSNEGVVETMLCSSQFYVNNMTMVSRAEPNRRFLMYHFLPTAVNSEVMTQHTHLGPHLLLSRLSRYEIPSH